MVEFRELTDENIAANKAEHSLLSKLPHEDWCDLGPWDDFPPGCSCLTSEVVAKLRELGYDVRELSERAWIVGNRTTVAHLISIQGPAHVRTKCGARVRWEFLREASPSERRCMTCTGMNRPRGRGRPQPTIDLVDTDEL